MLDIDILLYSVIVKMLLMNLIFLLTSVMVELYMLMENSWLVQLKIFGKVENPNFLTLTLMLNLVSTS
jgi:hypothetical protein